MKNSDKKILVTRSSIPPVDEYMEEIKEIWDSHWLTNFGSKHRELSEKLKSYLGVERIQLTVNGHLALEYALSALKLEGEVITTPFTFASTTHAIVRNGLIPVFCDVLPDTGTIDPSKIEDLITDRTCAIVPVHVYGNICDTEAIEDIAKRHNLKVIYDAAHAFGETYKGKGIGSFGDASIFSFHATKVYNTIEGGAVCFDDEEFGRALYGLINFGIRNAETVTGVGGNAKMNEFCAAMGLCNLRRVDDDIAKREKCAGRYRKRLEGTAGIRLNTVQKDVRTNYAYFPVFFDPKVFGKSRDEVKDALAGHDILARKYFYPLTSEFDCYKGVLDPGETPEAIKLASEVLTLPIYPDLSLEDIDRICDIILE
ncbi:MAG: DegT/DnrJ/EryC1/StrS family aminotransferase [Lachnospiraceae bacterium]|nr:DegT/DnrJ/EryC1/StrS family aminotransferase [Lachnospiraceae bacterium]